MIRVMVETGQVRLPSWVVDLESFRRWSDDEAFPETGQISFLKGDIWVDMSKEQLFSHNQVKMAIAFVLIGLVMRSRKGRYFGDGAFLSNAAADISNQPDGCFVSTLSLQQGLVRILEGVARGFVELEGSPEMVLEVVSDSSVEKDMVILRRAYAEAGIREYWLLDAREETPQFDILRLQGDHYVATRKRSGWVRSRVFGHEFRLTQQPGADGFPEYTLEVRPTR
jgi:Uma2 family endonuclease